MLCSLSCRDESRGFRPDGNACIGSRCRGSGRRRVSGLRLNRYGKHVNAQRKLVFCLFHDSHEKTDTDALWRIILWIDKFCSLLRVIRFAVVLETHENILAFMQDYQGDKVCSKQLFREALHNEYTQPQRWQTNEINDIVNQLIREGTLSGWRYFDKPRRFTGTDYGSQKGWERIPDVNEKMPTEDVFRQAVKGDYIPFLES